MEELAPTDAIGQRRMRAAHQMTATVDTTATRPHFWLPLALILLAAALLRGVFPTADPPWQSTVGIVWHDEGAWVHNARNMALFGAMGPGSRGTRFISHRSSPGSSTSRSPHSAWACGRRGWSRSCCGLLAVALLACGVRRLAGRDAGLIAGALLATNYVCVMWNRAALMEASMVAFIVAALVLLRPRAGTAALGCARRRVRAARLFHQGGSRIFRCRDRRRSRAALPVALAGHGPGQPQNSGCHGWRPRRMRRLSCSLFLSSRTGPTTSSTTGRCR